MEFSWEGEGPPKTLRHKIMFNGVEPDDFFITLIVHPELLGLSTSLGKIYMLYICITTMAQL